MINSIVREGADRIVPVGANVEVHFYPDGEVGIAHDCKMVDHNLQLRHAPALSNLGQPGGHQIVSVDPLTISPSVLCEDCGAHGWIRDGAWLPV